MRQGARRLGFRVRGGGAAQGDHRSLTTKLALSGRVLVRSSTFPRQAREVAHAGQTEADPPTFTDESTLANISKISAYFLADADPVVLAEKGTRTGPSVATESIDPPYRRRVLPSIARRLLRICTS